MLCTHYVVENIVWVKAIQSSIYYKAYTTIRELKSLVKLTKQKQLQETIRIFHLTHF